MTRLKLKGAHPGITQAKGGIPTIHLGVGFLEIAATSDTVRAYSGVTFATARQEGMEEGTLLDPTEKVETKGYGLISITAHKTKSWDILLHSIFVARASINSPFIPCLLNYATKDTTFSHVLLAFDSQNAIRAYRSGWNGEGLFIFMSPKTTFLLEAEGPIADALKRTEDFDVEAHENFMIQTSDGTLSTWRPTNPDLFADDWVIEYATSEQIQRRREEQSET